MVVEKDLGLAQDTHVKLDGLGASRIARGVKRADDRVVAFVKQRPVVAVCAAIAVGYLVGRIFTKIG